MNTNLESGANNFESGVQQSPSRFGRWMNALEANVERALDAVSSGARSAVSRTLLVVGIAGVATTGGVNIARADEGQGTAAAIILAQAGPSAGGDAQHKKGKKKKPKGGEKDSATKTSAPKKKGKAFHAKDGISIMVPGPDGRPQGRPRKLKGSSIDLRGATAAQCSASKLFVKCGGAPASVVVEGGTIGTVYSWDAKKKQTTVDMGRVSDDIVKLACPDDEESSGGTGPFAVNVPNCNALPGGSEVPATVDKGPQGTQGETKVEVEGPSKTPGFDRSAKLACPGKEPPKPFVEGGKVLTLLGKDGPVDRKCVVELNCANAAVKSDLPGVVVQKGGMLTISLDAAQGSEVTASCGGDKEARTLMIPVSTSRADLMEKGVVDARGNKLLTLEDLAAGLRAPKSDEPDVEGDDDKETGTSAPAKTGPGVDLSSVLPTDAPVESAPATWTVGVGGEYPIATPAIEQSGEFSSADFQRAGFSLNVGREAGGLRFDVRAAYKILRQQVGAAEGGRFELLGSSGDVDGYAAGLTLGLGGQKRVLGGVLGLELQGRIGAQLLHTDGRDNVAVDPETRELAKLPDANSVAGTVAICGGVKFHISKVGIPLGGCLNAVLPASVAPGDGQPAILAPITAEAGVEFEF